MSRAKLADVVVIGAGAAGIGVCSGLAAKYPNLNILMLEAGPSTDAPPASRTPLLYHFQSWMRGLAPFQRSYETVKEAELMVAGSNQHRRAVRSSKQPSSQNSDDGRSLRITKGRGFGGSTLLDDMRCMRGTRADIDSWKSPQWTWEHMTETLRRVEKNSRGRSELHGEDGHVPVSDPFTILANSDLNIRFFEACEAAGAKSCADFNDGTADGSGTFQSFISRGSRVDLFNTLIHNERHRTQKLDVRSGATVKRLTIDTSTGTCTGVELENGEIITAKQVVVCAGTIESPLLLQRSGIGATGDLERAGVKPVVALDGVGKNLIVQPTVDTVFRCKPSALQVTSRSFHFQNLTTMWRQWKEYLGSQTGVFTSHSEAAAFVRSVDGAPHPDLCIAFTPMAVMNRGAKWANFHGYTASVTLHHAQSRGSVRLAPASAAGSKTVVAGSSAEIETNMLSQTSDFGALDEGLMWVGLLCSPGSPLQSGYHQLPSKDLSFEAPFNELLPSWAQPSHSIGTPMLAQKYVREFVYAGESMFGTCAMGDVVDGNLAVRGVKGLYVADCSVVPHSTTANSRTMGLLIGRRWAELM